MADDHTLCNETSRDGCKIIYVLECNVHGQTRTHISIKSKLCFSIFALNCKEYNLGLLDECWFIVLLSIMHFWRWISWRGIRPSSPQMTIATGSWFMLQSNPMSNTYLSQRPLEVSCCKLCHHQICWQRRYRMNCHIAPFSDIRHVEIQLKRCIFLWKTFIVKNNEDQRKVYCCQMHQFSIL